MNRTNMFRIYRYLIPFILLLLTAACSEDIVYGGNDEQGVPMEFTFMAPGACKTTTSENSVNDGSLIKNLAVFFCKETGSSTEVKAYRYIELKTPRNSVIFNMSETDTNKESWAYYLDDNQNRVAIDGTKKNGWVADTEKGIFKIYAVANFTDNTSITNLINDINTNVSGTTIDNNKINSKFADLKKTKINCGTNNLCDAHKMMVLSLCDEINIGPGTNSHTSHLLRTYTRVKVTVRNESLNRSFTINNLLFLNITQFEIPLFVTSAHTPSVGNKTPYILEDGKLTSPYYPLAIEEFKPVTLRGIDEVSKNPNSAVIFDGYILESYAPTDADGNQKYTFRLGIGDFVKNEEVVVGEKTQYSLGLGGGSMSNNGTDYIIEVVDEGSQNKGKVLYNNGTDIELKPKPNNNDLNSMEEDERNKYFWIYTNNFIQSKYNYFCILPNENGKEPNGESVKLGAESGNGYTVNYNKIYWEGNLGIDEGNPPSDHNIKGDEWDNGGYIKKTKFYLNALLKWNNTGTNLKSSNGGFLEPYYWHYEAGNLPDKKIFSFIPVNKKVTDITESIPTYANDQKFDFKQMVNNKAEIVKSIHRNDYYNIYINVRFNEKTKTFDFSVENWKDEDLQIEFN